MTFLHRRTLRPLSRALLVYLLGLYLVGLPWHQHPDAQTAKHATDQSVVVANDACLLCDWLVQPSLVVPTFHFEDETIRSFEELKVTIPSPGFTIWTGQSGGSRAPPAA